MTARGVAAAIAAAALAACGPGYEKIQDYPCPPQGTTLTYDDFGRGFMSAYCQSCHGQPESARHGAPPDYDFRSLDAVRAYKDRIFARAAEDNTSMPPGPDDPPAAARHDLAVWLACGAP